MASLVRVLERLLVAALLLVVALASSVALLTTPAFTRVLTARLDVASSSGLADQQASSSAELVRRFVTTRSAARLPAEVDGRSGFDAAAVSHLEDVREVILASRLLGLISAAALVLWAAVSLRRRRADTLASGLRTGGLTCVVAPVLVAAIGALDFEALFTVFHGLFFAEGTWTFSADSLLIELFPEPFWIIAGVSLALLVIAQGAVFLALGAAVGGHKDSRVLAIHQADA